MTNSPGTFPPGFDGCARCYEDLSDYDGAVLIAEGTNGSNVICARGNWANAPVWFGEAYTFQYRFSGFRLQNPGNGMVSPNSRRVRVRRAFLRYHGTHYFRVVVTPERREPQVHEFDAVTLDSRVSQVGSVFGDGLDIEKKEFFEGVYQFPVMADGDRVSVEIVNDSAQPCQFLNCEWVGAPSRNTLT